MADDLDEALRTLEFLLPHLGGVVATAQLHQAGIAKREIFRLVNSNVLTRVRRGVYVSPALTGPRLTAAQLGGRVTGETLMSLLGAWTLPGPRPIHISFSHDRHLPARMPPGVKIHWTQTEKIGLDEEIGIAISHLVGFHSFEESVTILDSLIHKKVMDDNSVRRHVGNAHRRKGRMVLRYLDGSAESGAESLMRIWLQRNDIHYQTQVIMGSYRVDFLVGVSLIVEVVGKSFHADLDKFEYDGTREAFLQSLGYTVLRITASQVLQRWDEAEQALLSIIRTRRHLRPLKHRRPA